MTRTVTGVDIGARTNKFLRGAWKGKTFAATHFAVSHHAEAELANAWRASELDFKPTESRIGLSGREVNIRYTRVPRVPDWQLRKLMRFEVEEIGGQSGAEVASDFNVLPNLPEVEGEDVVLLAMARESLLTEHQKGLAALAGTLDAFTPTSIALYNAWLRFGAIQDETVLLADLGHENLDVILVRGPDLLFARNLSGGSSLFDAAIAERFNVNARKAEELKRELATLETGKAYKDANQEKASRACAAAAGQILSLLQSTILFCKSQVKLQGLRVDRVLLCGGGARLAGLPRYLQNGFNVPVELFDPFQVVDTQALSPEAREELDQHRLEAVGALGLATLASDSDAYAIEIVPQAVQKQRQFFGGTLFLIAAGVVGLAFLGFEALHTQKALEETSTKVASADGRLRRSNSTDQRTRELVAESQLLASRADALAQLAGQGEQLARSVQALSRGLPDDFWLGHLSSERRFDEALGVARGAERPIVHVEGRTREGTESTSVLFEAFEQGLRAKLVGAALAPKLSNTGDKFTLDLTLFAPTPEVKTAEAE